MRPLVTILVLVSLVLTGIFLPRWAALLVLAGWAGVAWFAGRHFQRSVDEGVARSRGFVLRNATVVTDEIERLAGNDVLSLKIELTITPRPGNAQLRDWRPDSLRLRAAKGEVPPESVEIDAPGGWSHPGGTAVKGKQRLRLTVSVPPETPRLVLCYFLEDLADMDLLALSSSVPIRDQIG